MLVNGPHGTPIHLLPDETRAWYTHTCTHPRALSISIAAGLEHVDPRRLPPGASCLRSPPADDGGGGAGLPMLRNDATSSRIEARCCWICALRSASFCSAASCHRSWGEVDGGRC